MKKDLIYQTGLAPEGAGYLKVSLFEDDFITIENHLGILDMKSQCIKIFCAKKILGIFGENLSIKELDGCILKIKGKIFKIEYLTWRDNYDKII